MLADRSQQKRHASVRKALRQAWELGDADKAEKLLRSLARRLEREAPGVSVSVQKVVESHESVVESGESAVIQGSRPG